MRVYATAADWYEFLGGEQPTVPGTVTEEDPNPEPVPLDDAALNALLRRASIRVEGYTRRARYDVDEDGYPTDADVAEAFKWATCAQADWFTTTGDLTGAESQEGMVRIGSVQIGGGNTSSASAARSADQSRVSPEAIEILTNAGLISAATAHS